jgi:hypothetical protein
MRTSLVLVLLLGCSLSACLLLVRSLRAGVPAINDPKDIRLGMAEPEVIRELKDCCAARQVPPEAAGIWGAVDHVGQIWNVYFHNGVVVEITRDVRIAGSSSAATMLELVTNDLVQHCPPDSRFLQGERGPGYLEAAASQYDSPDPVIKDKFNWRSSIAFSCGTHRVSIGEVQNDRIQVTFTDAVPNPMMPRGASIKP